MFKRITLLTAFVLTNPVCASSDPNHEELSFCANGATFVLLNENDWDALLTPGHRELLSLPKRGANLSADYTGDKQSSTADMRFSPSGDCDDLNVVSLSRVTLEGPQTNTPFVPWELAGISTQLLERGIGIQIVSHSGAEATEPTALYQRGFLRYRPSDEIVYYMVPLFNRIYASPDAWSTFMNFYNLFSAHYPGKKEAIIVAPFLDPFLEGIHQKLQDAGFTITAVDVPPICAAIELEEGEGRELRYLSFSAAGFTPDEAKLLRQEWNFMRRAHKPVEECRQKIYEHVCLKLFSPLSSLKLGQIYLTAKFANLSAMVMQLYPPEPQADGRLLTMNSMGGMTPAIDKITQSWINFSTIPGFKTLEIGTSYGLALMKAIEAGAQDLTANDVDIRHLLIFARTLKLRFPEHMERVKIIPGRFPKDFLLEPTYDSMLMARVLHFMKPIELFQAMHAAHSILKPLGRLFIVALTPYVRAYMPFIEEYKRRKAEKQEYPGYVENLADWVDPNLIPPEKQKVMGLHIPFMFLDPDTLKRHAEKVGFRVLQAEFMGLPYESSLWGLNGEENAVMICEKIRM